MKLRTAEPRDAAAIARVHVDSWQEAYRGLMPDELLDRLDPLKRTQLWRRVLSVPEWPVFVLEDEDRILGFCHITPGRDPDADPMTTADITALYLDPGLWRRGYGRQLCEQAVAELSRRGFTSVVLWVLEENTGARLFYERLDFQPDGQAKTDAASGLREVRYRRQIGGG